MHRAVDIEERSERADPMAKRLFSLLRSRSEADRRLVYEALRTRISDKTSTASQQIAVVALQRFDRARVAATTAAAADARAEAPNWAQAGPSRRRYNSFRDAQPDPKSWPSSQLISNAFNYQWAEALKAAGLAVAPDVLAMRRTTLPDPFSKSEIEAILRTWISLVDADDPARTLKQGDFFVWLERQRRDPNSRLKRWPSRPTVRKHMGSWTHTLVQLGQAARHPMISVAHGRTGQSSAAERAWAATAVAAIELDKLKNTQSGRGRKRAWGVEELSSWMRVLTASLTEQERSTLTMAQWDLLRRSLLIRLLAEQGRVVDVPCACRISADPEIASWPHAKVLAGIAEIDDAEVTNTRNESYDDSELEAALLDVVEELGHLPSQAEYRRERVRLLEHRRRKEPWAHLPHDGTLRLRLAKEQMRWSEVLETLCERYPHLQELDGNARRATRAETSAHA